MDPRLWPGTLPAKYNTPLEQPRTLSVSHTGVPRTLVRRLPLSLFVPVRTPLCWLVTGLLATALFQLC